MFANHGQRVVNDSDAFLGWTMGGPGRHYFFRQLRDIKLSAAVELFDA